MIERDDDMNTAGIDCSLDAGKSQVLLIEEACGEDPTPRWKLLTGRAVIDAEADITFAADRHSLTVEHDVAVVAGTNIDLEAAGRVRLKRGASSIELADDGKIHIHGNVVLHGILYNATETAQWPA